MSDHTPGPWEAHSFNNEDYIDIDAGGERICSIFLSTADICFNSNDPTDTEENEIIRRKANARLIAAAPKMLAALENIYNDACDREETEDEDGVEYGDWRMVREAIEKAKGEKL